MTWAPAPMAKSVSVCVGASETMRCGASSGSVVADAGVVVAAAAVVEAAADVDVTASEPSSPHADSEQGQAGDRAGEQWPHSHGASKWLEDK